MSKTGKIFLLPVNLRQETHGRICVPVTGKSGRLKRQPKTGTVVLCQSKGIKKLNGELWESTVTIPS